MAVLTMPYVLQACPSPLPRRPILHNISSINPPLDPNVVRAGWACLALQDSAARTGNRVRVNCAKSRARVFRLLVCYLLCTASAFGVFSRRSLQDRRWGFSPMTPLSAHDTQPWSILASSTASLGCDVTHLIVCRPLICPASQRVGFKLNLRGIPWTSEASNKAVDI